MEIKLTLDKEEVYYTTCVHMVKQAKKLKNINLNNFSFYKTHPTSIDYYDITFQYKNQIFAVLINMCHKGDSILQNLAGQKDKLVRFCQKNNFIPCLFPIDLSFRIQSCEHGHGIYFGDSRAPRTVLTPQNKDGWNLIHAVTNAPVIPTEYGTDTPALLPEYGQYFFAAETARRTIEQKYGHIITCNDFLPENAPQFIYHNRKLNTSQWCCIKVTNKPLKDLTESEKDSFIKEINMTGNGICFFIYFYDKNISNTGYDFAYDIKEVIRK